jgi:hypothetical protein
MIQFYLLSVLLNAATGYVLVLDSKEREDTIEASFGISVNSEVFRLILGVLTMVTGLLKLLSSVPGDLPVIGDLIPSAIGLASGFILVFEFYRSRSTLDTEKTDKIEGTLIKNKKWIGFIALASAVLHFLFPSVLLL